MTPFSIHPATNIATVFLTVTDLQRSERFYHDVLAICNGQEDRRNVGSRVDRKRSHM